MYKNNLIVSTLAAISLIGCAASANASERVEALEELAAEQHPKALYHLGMMYLTGTEVEKDQRRAVEYFERSNALGDPLAAYKLGCFFDGQYQLLDLDLARALELKLIAAEAGYALAQQDVAMLYARQGETDIALNWLKRAADQGTSGALATYASVHNGAQGVEKDPVKTAAYFRIFVERTDASSRQKNWLEEFEGELTPSEIAAAKKIVNDYRPRPTALTLEALSGLSAVDELLRNKSREL